MCLALRDAGPLADEETQTREPAGGRLLGRNEEREREQDRRHHARDLAASHVRTLAPYRIPAMRFRSAIAADITCCSSLSLVVSRTCQYAFAAAL